MKKNKLFRSIKLLPLLLVIIFISSLKIYPYTDQATSERILKENRDFINFINVCITNFNDSKKDEFLKIYEKHFNADIAYLQSDYRRAFKRVYASQQDMAKLYEDMLKDFYLEDSKKILDKIAPEIIRSKNARARLYLTLGYRDRTISWTHFTVGESSNPKLHSYRLYKYVEGIKMARRAKRYGFLALFECQTQEKKREIYNKLFKSEKESGNLFFNRFVDLNDEQMIKELTKTFDEYEKELKDKGIKDNKGVKDNKDIKDTEAKDNKKSLEQKLPESKTFERRVEKRVRFRSEVRVAKYILNTEYEKAEDIIRKYIDDFNFKLIMATFEVLSAKKDKEKPGGTQDGQGEPSSGTFDYNAYKVHLMDNYARLTKVSILDTILDKVKVEDDIRKTEKADKEIDDKKGVDEKKDDQIKKDEKSVDDKSKENIDNQKKNLQEKPKDDKKKEDNKKME